MNSEAKESLLRILREARIEDVEHWMSEAQEYNTPVLEKALFLREAWSSVVRKGNTDWIDQNIETLKQRVGRKDAYALRFLPEQPDTLAALEHVKESGVSLAAVSQIVRDSQISVLTWLVSIIDGGHCFRDGLSSNWSLCANDEEGEPAESFGVMTDYVWEFDPDRVDS